MLLMNSLLPVWDIHHKHKLDILWSVYPWYVNGDLHLVYCRMGNTNNITHTHINTLHTSPAKPTPTLYTPTLHEPNTLAMVAL